MRHRFIFVERCKQVCVSSFRGRCVNFWKLWLPTVQKLPKSVAGRSRRPRAQHHSGSGARICMKPGSCISFTEATTYCHYSLLCGHGVICFSSWWWQREMGRGFSVSDHFQGQTNVVGRNNFPVCLSKARVLNMPQQHVYLKRKLGILACVLVDNIISGSTDKQCLMSQAGSARRQ